MKLCLSISLSKKTTSVGSGFLLHNNIGEVLAASCVQAEKNLNTLIRDSFDINIMSILELVTRDE